jgi:hypothetical protein
VQREAPVADGEHTGGSDVHQSTIIWPVAQRQWADVDVRS